MLSQLIPRVKDEFGTITVPTIPIKEDSTVRKIVYIYIKLVTTKRLSITENKKRTRSLLLRPTFFYFIFPILLFFFFFFSSYFWPANCIRACKSMRSISTWTNTHEKCYSFLYAVSFWVFLYYLIFNIKKKITV
jgi:hypothetical protein